MTPYPLNEELGMGVVCVTLRLSLRKGGYVGHLHWDSMRKSPTAWDNLCGARVLGMGYTIYERYGKKITDTECPMLGTCFGNFMRVSKFWMGVIKNQEFRVTSKMAKYLLI